jgi:TRAP-type C4-dicarboxylate transport system substrate-binding protein
MKKTISIILILVMVCMSFAGCSSEPAAEQPSEQPSEQTEENNESVNVTSEYGYDLTEFANVDWPEIDLVTSAQQDEDGSISMMTRFYIDMISEASGGKVTFTDYWNATFCGGRENYDNIRDGIVDYGEVPSNYEYTPFFLYQIAYSIPFVSTDFVLNGEAVMNLANQHPEFAESNEKAGVYVTAVRGIENYICPSNQELVQDTFTLDWYDGSRVAVGSSFYSKWIEALGAIPITGGSAAANYEGYMNGVIDGSFVSDSLICDYQYYEVCKSVIEMDIGARGSTLSCWNIDTWNSFSPEVQEALQGIADLCVEEYNKVLNESIASYEDKIYNEYGLTKIMLSDEVKSEWCEKILADDKYNTMKIWIAEAEELGVENAEELMADFFKSYEDLGHEFIFDVDTSF